MPFVRRDALGVVTSLHQTEDAGLEFLSSEHPDVRSFLTALGPSQNDFARLDADFVRVLEDVIDTLIGKNLINLTDLPAEAQAKLLSRKSFRERRHPRSLHLFGETQFDEFRRRTKQTGEPG